MSVRLQVCQFCYLEIVYIIDRSLSAYDDVMKSMTIAATAFAVVPLILAFFIPNWYLGDQQNAVENVDLKGEKAENPDLIAQRS